MALSTDDGNSDACLYDEGVHDFSVGYASSGDCGYIDHKVLIALLRMVAIIVSMTVTWIKLKFPRQQG